MPLKYFSLLFFTIVEMFSYNAVTDFDANAVSKITINSLLDPLCVCMCVYFVQY